MTKDYLTNITPDSLSGILFALDGFQNTVVLLNGPTGCKFYHSATSDHQGLRQMEFDPLSYPELWYFGQPRIPCTYLDKRDYVYGSAEKLQEALHFLEQNVHFDLVAVVNSPGEALIGDDLPRIVAAALPKKPVLTIETPGYSRPMWEGYTKACLSLFRQLPLRKEALEGKTVNLLGLSIFHKYYEGDIREMTRLLGLCGIRVHCTLCCDCSLNSLYTLPSADLNVVLDPVYGLDTARYLEEAYRMPYVVGMPIGFSATEALIHEICGRLHCDPAAFDVESEKTRARAFIHISRINSLTGLPKGAKFAVQGTEAQCYAYSDFFIHYLGMRADALSVTSPVSSRLRELLQSVGMEEALDKEILDTAAELVFSDGNLLAKLKARHHTFSGIEISLPTIGYEDVIPKTHLGLVGALRLLENIINGLLY